MEVKMKGTAAEMRRFFEEARTGTVERLVKVVPQETEKKTKTTKQTKTPKQTTMTTKQTNATNSTNATNPPKPAALIQVHPGPTGKRRVFTGLNCQKRWTGHDDSALLMLSKEGRLLEDVALLIGRTQLAVKNRRQKLNLGLKQKIPVRVSTNGKRRQIYLGKNRHQPWTHSDIRALKELLSAGMKPKKIAKSMGRTVRAIYSRKYQMLGWGASL